MTTREFGIPGSVSLSLSFVSLSVPLSYSPFFYISSPSSVSSSPSFPPRPDALDPPLPLRPPPHPSAMDNSHEYSSLPNSCIPNVVPPGVDPSTVDFREFYPYIPNEIKHRKRTTPAQLEILEQTFALDKKPNGVMRANLARQLDMTPRGVQVSPRIFTTTPDLPPILTCLFPSIPRFGSRTGVPTLHIPLSSISPSPLARRRAKEKTLAKKAAAKQQHPQPSQANPAESQEGAGANDSISLQRSSSTATDSEHLSLSPPVSPPTVDGLDSPEDFRSAAPSIPSVRFDLTDPNHPINLRRGSLPIITRSTSDDYSRHRIQPTLDPLTRRGSLGIDVSRLAAHPYAHLAAAANNGGGNNTYPGLRQIRGHRIHGSGKSNSLPGAKAADQYVRLPPSYRPIPSHRASMPYVFSQGTPHSMDTAFVPIKHSTPAFTSRYHDGLYSMPSRPIAEPIPGPLPNPNFSFGDSSASPPAPSPSTSESEQLSVALNSYAFPPTTDADQEQEEPPNVSYGPFATRFSSIASLADSESSFTSAFYSEPGSIDEYPSEFHPHSRRQSQYVSRFSSSRRQSLTAVRPSVLDHFSNLGIEGHVTVSPTDSANRSPEQGHSSQNTSGVNTAYASPSMSDGSSPHTSTKSARYSLTSELASALSVNPDGSVPHVSCQRVLSTGAWS